jgi:exopolysaccharide production protein ExoQ
LNTKPDNSAASAGRSHDESNNREISAAAWGVWNLAVLNAAGLSFLSASQHAFIAVTTLILTIFLTPRRTYMHNNPSTGIIAFCLIVAIAFVSALWSVLPAVTLQQALLSGVALAQGVVIGSRASGLTMIKMVGSALFIVCFASALYELVSPTGARMQGYYETGALRGLVGHRNYLGYIAMLSIIVFVYALLDTIWKRSLIVIALGVSGYVLLRTESQTALLLSIVGVLALLTFATLRRVTGRLQLPAMLAALVATGVASIAISSGAASLFAFLGRDSTLTGRTDIWASAFLHIQERPLLGYGWGAIWVDGSPVGASIRNTLGFTVAHAHNGYLDLALQIGIFGAMIVIVSLLVIGFRAAFALFATKDKSAALYLTLCIVILAYNFFESRVDKELGLLLFGLLASGVGALGRTRLKTLLP